MLGQFFLYIIRFTILSKELYNFLFSSTLYPSSRSSHCIFFPFFVYIIINLKQRPVQNMGKNIKSYATTQVHSPGKGREILRQKGPNLLLKIWYGLTVHIIRF